MADVSVVLRPRVLHVACNLGSGVAAAIASYVEATPELEHHLLAAFDPRCPVDDVTASMAGVLTLTGGPRDRVAQVRHSLRTVRPDVVHAHSSYAGLYVRLAAGDRRRVVHTPHCYGFCREDLALPYRAMVWAAEAALSLRTGAVAASSPAEEAAARRLPGRPLVRHVPNVAPARTTARSPRGTAVPLVVASGRLCAQKAPGLFAAAAREAVRRGMALRWTWVGGGDDGAAAELAAAGVRVTGWVTRESARAEIEGADVYVHTASWESAPLTVLEAAGADVPVLARDRRAMRLLGLQPRWHDVDELVDMLATYPHGPAFDQARAATRALAAAHGTGAQRDALLEVYGRAAGFAPTVGARQDQLVDSGRS